MLGCYCPDVAPLASSLCIGRCLSNNFPKRYVKVFTYSASKSKAVEKDLKRAPNKTAISS